MSSTDGELTPQQERYIDTILAIESEKSVARVKEIAAALNVKASTVTNAIKTLTEQGYTDHERYGRITLTPRGLRVARHMLLRRQAIHDLLRDVLGVLDPEATEVAEQFSHAVPPTLLCRMIQFNDFYQKTTQTKYKWQPNCSHLCEDKYSFACAVSTKNRSK